MAEDKPKNKGGRPLLFDQQGLTEEDLDKKIKDYFQDCLENDRHCTYSGLAVWLDTNRSTLFRYVNEHVNDKFRIPIKRGLATIEQYYEQMMIGNKGSTIGLIFALKNNFKWADKQEIGIDLSPETARFVMNIGTGKDK